MLKLLEVLSVQEIVVYLVLFALAARGVFDFVEWVRKEYSKKFNKDYTAKKKEEDMSSHFIQCEAQRQEVIKMYAEVDNKIDKLTHTVNAKFTEIEKQLKRLTDSDMHDIKSWIVEKHHIYIKQGWIDDFQMDTIEKRYDDYLAEGGNSYVLGLMQELRALPHSPNN